MWRCDRARRSLTRFALGLAIAGLAGCATVAPPPTPPTAVDGPRDWTGRFSVTLASDLPGGRQDAAAGRFTLLARPTAGGRVLELQLTSPFGQTLADARRAPDGASSLTLSDGRTLRGASLDAVIEQALGWPLPIDRLPDWLDDRFQTVLERDARGEIALAADSGWRIEREPRRWAFQRPHADGRLRVVLVLDR
jgi:outer membrane biogenesis lipoprotein LolB